MPPSSEIRSLLLVRNGVDHDARVLRAARVAERTLGGRALVVGAATTASPAGPATVEGIAVVRLPARAPRIADLVESIERSRRRWAGRLSGAGAGSRAGRRTAKHARGAGTRAGGRAATPAGVESPTTGSQLAPAVRGRRIIGGISYTLQAVGLARRVRAELVHANDWNTMWAGLFVKYLGGAQLVYDSHELWADRNGRWEWRPWLLLSEALFVRAADEVLTSSPGYADVLAARYRTPRPTVVRNIPENRFAIPAELPAGSSGVQDGALPRSAARSRARERPVAASADGGRPAVALVVYVGGLMPGRGLERMIDALPLIPEARLRAIGPVAPRYRASLLTRAEAAGVADRLELRAPVPPTEVGSALAGAAVGLCLIQPICRSYELSLPNKLFEYAAAGVPVLASDLPVIGELVRRDGFGVLTSAEDPHTIAASLERLLEPGSWRLAAQRARVFAATHNWASEARTLATAYRRGGR
jgi:glycosyltransferase involved in cell wall biosynthesis